MSNDKSYANGEFFKHIEREDGTRELLFGETGAENHGHAVLDQHGNVQYLREQDGHVVANDSKG